MEARDYCALIESPMPSCAWVEHFLADIKRQGGNDEKIAWECGVLRKGEFKNTPRIKRAFQEMRSGIQTVYLPVLAPKFHEKWSAQIALYGLTLAANPHSFVVYDYCDLPLGRETAEIDSLLAMICHLVGAQRVQTREQAIAALIERTTAVLCVA